MGPAVRTPAPRTQGPSLRTPQARTATLRCGTRGRCASGRRPGCCTAARHTCPPDGSRPRQPRQPRPDATRRTPKRRPWVRSVGVRGIEERRGGVWSFEVRRVGREPHLALREVSPPAPIVRTPACELSPPVPAPRTLLPPLAPAASEESLHAAPLSACARAAPSHHPASADCREGRRESGGGARPCEGQP
jgi:hypothetical protein